MTAPVSQPPEDLPVETVDLASLRPHPRNYRSHPEDQLTHLAQSLREHGFYRNIVVARDGTILAGHGIAVAAARLGLERVPVRRMPLDPLSPPALKILAADNELGRFAETDDRLLSELLRQIREEDAAGLLGTGYDDLAVAALVMVTRTAAEIADFDAAAEWVGLPEYDAGKEPPKLVVNFRTEEDRDRFIGELGLRINHSKGGISTWWPPRERGDLQSLRFVTGAAPEE